MIALSNIAYYDRLKNNTVKRIILKTKKPLRVDKNLPFTNLGQLSQSAFFSDTYTFHLYFTFHLL